MRVIFVTGNSNKLEEAKRYLKPLGMEVEQMMIDGSIPELIEPQFDDLEKIAIFKADQAIAMIPESEKSDCAILVEDSGLFIDSLNGFPGSYSSFVFRKIGVDGILRLMSGKSMKGCEYRAVSVLVIGGRTIIAKGICRGNISEEISGTGGFGYDPIFIPEDSDGRTFAQMTKEEKSSISHRGKSLKTLCEAISSPSM
ncbi:MAG: non-canonical purine NTP pyrophosphatase, RdgB/HAM1 family [Euryarchaeota archaeon]|jgi:XTP/dITP diphosphohydrolase|nr:non-canonical purine NTP pyrophosphatase, RdgB/HAM1 family [Euryarchaeota archaeon]|tara:strand:+ start:1781 stop:2374 length:594 start_codon:yes stop_codon:yes gene_type:complete